MSFFDTTNNFIKNLDTDGGYAIHFTHVASGRTTYFKAFITSWEDSYEQDWKNYPTIGRMDDIRIFAKTSRSLNFSIEIPSAGVEEATRNFASIQELIQMSYPVFEEIKVLVPSSTTPNSVNTPEQTDANAAINQATSPSTGNGGLQEKRIASMMGAPPFMIVNFANWAQNHVDGALFNRSTPERKMLPNGLYGVIKNIKFSPDFSAESSGFYGSNSIGQLRSNVLVPKAMKLSINMSVINIDQLGYRFDEDLGSIQPRTPDFPYKANDIKKSLNDLQNQPPSQRFTTFTPSLKERNKEQRDIFSRFLKNFTQS